MSFILFSMASSFCGRHDDLLRGDCKQSEYGKDILTFTVLHRLDCVLEATKDEVLAECANKQKGRYGLGVNR
jgi:type I restriction enzyme M protein